jgi:phosphoserine aminotransferase
MLSFGKGKRSEGIIMRKVFNFSAGPAILSEKVLSSAAEAVREYQNSGMSLLEMSHRSVPVGDMVAETSALVRELYGIPEHYQVLWLQGGASLQFAMIPMNLLGNGDQADYVDTGRWSAKAIQEAQRFGNVNVAGSAREQNYTYIPKTLEQSPQAVYLHITSNNTIYGTQWKTFPVPLNPDGYLVADMSSDILSRPIDITRFGLIYAGAQKNLGPAGVTLVIVREDILGRIDRDIPTMLDYRTHIGKQSLYNTPPVFAIYVVNRTLHWIKEQVGGLERMEALNQKKADKLYAEIERNSLFKSPVAREDRSVMNIPFIMQDRTLEAEFLSFAEDRGLLTLKGHRSVGGFRASLYNAMLEEGVDRLIATMQEFEQLKG